MKKFLFLLLSFFIFVNCSKAKNIEEPENALEKTKPVGKIVGMANPWTNCGTDFDQAAQIAGFTFPLKLSKCNVRAMKGMIEINYPLDEKRTVCIRKADTDKFSKNGDISGVYINYPVNEEITLQNSIPIQIRGTQDKIYVMNMSAYNGYYCAYCKEGMNLQETEKICNIIEQAETTKK